MILVYNFQFGSIMVHKNCHNKRAALYSINFLRTSTYSVQQG